MSKPLSLLLLLLQVKGLAHPGHWSGPLGPFFEQFGAVKAGPMTAFKLLKDGEQVRRANEAAACLSLAASLVCCTAGGRYILCFLLDTLHRLHCMLTSMPS
jgi:hypothetical protein